jgi:hypothetical protein
MTARRRAAIGTTIDQLCVGKAALEFPQTHRGMWVEPTLLAEIEYRAKSAEGQVRDPVFRACAKICEPTLCLASAKI